MTTLKTSEKEKERVSFYIDGFNIYHRIRDYHRKTGKNYRWLDYRSFCESFLFPNQEIGDIYFFTASLPDIFSEKIRKRHRQFIEALISRDIKVIEGYFNRGKEKQTDINIAARLIVDAAKKRYDRCFLFSGDNDFAPALLAVKEVGEGTEKPAEAMLLTPPYERRRVGYHGIHSLRKAVEGRVVEVTFSDFDGHSLPAEIPTKHGIIKKPAKYDCF